VNQFTAEVAEEKGRKCKSPPALFTKRELNDSPFLKGVRGILLSF